MARALAALTVLLAGFAGAAPVGRARVVLPVRFDLGPAAMAARFDAAHARLGAAADRIAAAPTLGARFADTFGAYETALADFAEAVEPMTVLADVSPDPEVRAAAQALSERQQQAVIALTAREDLYAALAAAPAEGLSPVEARLRERVLADFKEAGHGLSAEDRSRLLALQSRLAALTERFEENLREDRGEIEAELSELAGVPSDLLDAMPRTPEGRVRVSLDMATYQAVMTSARDAGLRRRLELADQRRGVEENPAILREGLALRAEAARLRGFPTFAHMALSEAMAGAPERVAAFFERVRAAIGARAERDRAELLARKRQDEPGAERLESYDRFYYEERLRRERFGVDPDEVRSYFPLERVLPGVLRVYGRMLGVEFRPVLDAPVWHAEVRVFDAYDADGALLGRVYLDLIAREGKYGFAAMQPVSAGRALPDGSYRAPTAMVMANFPRPAPGRPVLLPHSDVETLFHEFGHVMHELLTRSPYASMAGSQVAMDFAELPSQIMENLAWDPEVLAEVSGRVEDGAPLPAALLERLVAARSFQRGLFYLRQLAFAMVDQSLHAAAPADPVEASNRLIEAVLGFRVQPGAAPVASYEYLFGGYEAFYYGYAWSEVYAEDAWSRFRREGLTAAGAAFRREILERGSSRPEADSLRAFLGREPSLEAFIAKLLEEPRS
ncbi:MAG: M3 family metallopeptidase [Elusimicrobiota bacterium]|nr:M3 family metallopeptidase [Elusimicrobiota bacterium]